AHHFTITRARICGWSAQKYSYAPGRVNVCANVSSLPSPADANAPVVDVIVCVSSSRLVHRTVVPAETWSAAVAHLNLLIPRSAARPTAATLDSSVTAAHASPIETATRFFIAPSLGASSPLPTPARHDRSLGTIRRLGRCEA